MSHNRTDKPRFFFEDAPLDVRAKIETFFTRKDKVTLQTASDRSAHRFYQQEIDLIRYVHLGLKEKVQKILDTYPSLTPFAEQAHQEETRKICSHILQGNQAEVVRRITLNPHLLLRKENITNEDIEEDETFRLKLYHISPYQLIQWLFDADMLEKVLPLIPTDQETSQTFINQSKEMAFGGNDLIKMDEDPSGVPFDKILRYQDPHDVTYPNFYSRLMNQDGIVFYNQQFYKVEQHTQSVTLLRPQTNETNWSAFEKFLSDMSSMPVNTSKRSNDQQHRLIADVLGHTLSRSGIPYELGGVRYRNTRNPLPIIAAHLEYIRLSRAQPHGTPHTEALDVFWKQTVGGAQRMSPMWCIQYQATAPEFQFVPVDPEGAYAFHRESTITVAGENYIDNVPLLPFKHRAGLGWDYALSRQLNPTATGFSQGISYWRSGVDLVQLNQIQDIKTAKTHRINQIFVQAAELTLVQNRMTM